MMHFADYLNAEILNQVFYYYLLKQTTLMQDHEGNVAVKWSAVYNFQVWLFWRK